MTRVYLVRHADVENPKRVLYGHLPGFALSERGRAQAVDVGRTLRDRGIGRIVHSPLQRAVETAELINAELPAPVPLAPEPELREAEFGKYLQGVPYWQIPIVKPRWHIHRARRGLLPDDESLAEMGGRVTNVVFREAAEHPDDATVLVSHADPLNAAWIVLDGRPHTEREMARKMIDRAGFLEVDVEDGKVVAVNYVAPPKPAAPDGQRAVTPPSTRA